MSTHKTNQDLEAAWSFLAGKLTSCGSELERHDLVKKMVSGNGPRIVSFLNAHACNLSLNNPDFYNSLSNSDYLLRDGVGIEIHLLLRAQNPGVNLNGTDLIPDIITEVNSVAKRKISLFGSKVEYVTSAQETLAKRGVHVEILDGFRPDQDYIDHAIAMRPRLIVLGMGMPKQEMLSEKLQKELGASDVLIVNGGAVIDFIAGRYPRAPRWIRRIRLESLYRLSMEPRRLWRRNVGSLIFLKRSITAKLCNTK